MAQKQCPNCGGYKLGWRTSDIKGKIPVTLGDRLWWGGLGVIWLAFSFLCFLTSGNRFTAGVSILLISIGVLVLGAAAFQKITYKKVATLYHFTCQICGYTFDWDERTPYPKVTVRHDLIVKGAQRLEEERRRQEEGAAAAWWLQQQKKK